ncbi:putative nuclease (RNAse H fold) [Dehalogenimonas formicexedens]|uniref:Putative nuclease (RNAse H fold) n=1 Tax=Dehalogenimonas formicexedens TaxID=1839801 RepID=A0A1P8F7N9_9CHLR|nr:DUF429 domain-containing protein [Dehalogenimonas formicexedens]APV44468.1 putative nuclease (RNAse H fold) [Dehalogenimonas formicexedens]
MNSSVGVDVSKGRWLAVQLFDDASWDVDLFPTFTELWKNYQEAKWILVDIPIGLIDEGAQRACDTMARSLLGDRQFSVFQVPCRAALMADSWGEACEINRSKTGRRMSKQTYAIMPKIREVDEFLQATVEARKKILEIHPELCFWALNNSKPMEHNKKTEPGFKERLNILKKHQPKVDDILTCALAQPNWKIAKDDIVDALVGAMVGLLTQGQLTTLPDDPTLDSTGLAMQMVIPAKTYMRGEANEQ